MLKKCALLCFCFSSWGLLATPITMVVVDQHLSSYVGAKNLLFIHEGLQKAEDYLIQSATPSTHSAWEQTAARLLELSCIWYPINYLTMVVQHEVFGHGFKVRSLGRETCNVMNYKIGTPPPYGLGGGVTNYVRDLDKYTIYDNLATCTGGVEACTILAKQIKLSLITTGVVNPRQASLYIMTQHNLTDYIKLSTPEEGDDIYDYLSFIYLSYNQYVFSIEDLKSWSGINFLDPLTYYSLFSDFYYVFTGKTTSIPMIPIGSYKCLPNFRLGLTPFGPEWYFENFLVKNEQPFYFYLRNGSCGNTSYFGAGIEHANLLTTGTVELGLKFDCWVQPFNDFDNPKYSFTNVRKHFEEIIPRKNFENPFGFALSITMQKKKLWSENSYLYVELGGKTAGYLAGEPLQKALIARIGITLW